MINYQGVPNGDFMQLNTSRPGIRGNLLSTGTAGRILFYRSMYERQWDGQHAEVFEFKNGAIERIGAAARGQIYNLTPVYKEVVLAATNDPSGFRFIDTQSGAEIEPPFDLAKALDSRNVLMNSWALDPKGRLWLYSTLAPDNSTEVGRLHLWDGKELKSVLHWRFATDFPPLNPATSRMCATEQSLIWVGINERMLVLDSKTLEYRFFRTFDRARAPDLMISGGEWVMANYGANATAFHLELADDTGNRDENQK